MPTIYACFDVTTVDDDGCRVLVHTMVVQAPFSAARTLREAIMNARLAAFMEAHVEDRRRRGVAE